MKIPIQYNFINYSLHVVLALDWLIVLICHFVSLHVFLSLLIPLVTTVLVFISVYLIFVCLFTCLALHVHEIMQELNLAYFT